MEEWRKEGLRNEGSMGGIKVRVGVGRWVRGGSTCLVMPNMPISYVHDLYPIPPYFFLNYALQKVITTKEHEYIKSHDSLAYCTDMNSPML